MSISDIIKQNEKTFKGLVSLKYFFSPSVEKTDYLIVVFSGFNGKEEYGEPARYNYVKQLKNFDCNKLFILDDYDGHPCYYLGKNKSLDYETTVISLITSVASDLNIKLKNIIACGTSKGGTAALYFGMKYGFGHVIVGGMQTKVGDYLYNVNKYARDYVLKLITGGSSEKDRDYLNEFYGLIFNNPRQNTEYNIHGGSGDYHYINYVKPFVENLRANNISYRLDVQNYSDHGEIGTYFTDFLLDQLSRITGILTIKNVTINASDNQITVSCDIPEIFKKDNSTRYAFYFFKDKSIDPIEKFHYTMSSTVNYKPQTAGIYRARVYVKNKNAVVKMGTRTIELKAVTTCSS
jgi:hypothetical protein